MKVYTLFLFLLLACGIVTAQTLDEQFNELRESSGTYQTYKVIQKTELSAFWNTVLDSLNKKERTISEADQLIATQKQKIESLQEVIGEKDELLEEKEYAGTHINVFGIDFLKETYKVTNFVIISILLITMAVMLYRYKENSKIAKRKSNDFGRLETEFEEYKRNALEKQMKLRRDLQTARNKLDEIRSS